MRLIDFDVPEPYGADRTGENLRVVGAAIEPRRGWEDLTDPQCARWIEVIGHNTYDCLGLRGVIIRAATELASVGLSEEVASRQGSWGGGAAGERQHECGERD
jgi:hypothetical protein